MQLFVRGLGAYLLDDSATAHDLKLALEARQGFAAGLQSLVYAGRQLQDGVALRQQAVGPHATLHLAFRLRGGKGGFGALLRGAGRAAATENQDACRDLSGRRLRHVNADRKLQEWAAGGRERELEALGAKHVLDLQKAARAEAKAQVDTSVERERTEEAQRRVVAAVQRGLKRGGDHPGAGPSQAPKRVRAGPALLAALPELSDDSDSDAESESGASDEEAPSWKGTVAAGEGTVLLATGEAAAAGAGAAAAVSGPGVQLRPAGEAAAAPPGGSLVAAH